MSWSILLMKTSSGKSARPLGSRADVMQKIARVLKGVQWTSDTFGVLERRNLVLEVSLTGQDPITSVSLTPRGVPPFDPMKLISRLAKTLRCEAIDEDGQVIDFAEPDAREEPEFAAAFTSFFASLPAETRANFALQALDTWRTSRQWTPWQEQILSPFYEQRGDAPKAYMDFYRAVGWHKVFPPA